MQTLSTNPARSSPTASASRASSSLATRSPTAARQSSTELSGLAGLNTSDVCRSKPVVGKAANTQRASQADRHRGTTRGRVSLVSFQATLTRFYYLQEVTSSSSCLNASLISALINKFLSRSDSESPEKDTKVGKQRREQVRTRFSRLVSKTGSRDKVHVNQMVVKKQQIRSVYQI